MPTTPDRPADQLRAAVARALVRYDWNAGLSGRDTPSEHHYGEADAVLAVLPAPALAVARQLLDTSTGKNTADDEQQPIQLRWGLDDVMYGDDDTTTILLSGPDREPYWLELDPERTAALRDALAGPESAAPPAPLSEVWTVWREDDPTVYAHYTTVDAARQGTIDCWQEDEPSCPDYSWRQDGPRLELVVGGEHSGVYASRHRVYGAPPAPADRAAILRERADFYDQWLRDSASPGSDPRYCQAVHDIALGLRRLAGEAAAGAHQTEQAHRSYRLEHRRPGDTTWQRNTPGIGANWSWESRVKADQRLAEARTRWPDFEHRLIETTTTVTETPAVPAAPEEASPAPQCSAGLLPATEEAVDRCVRHGAHYTHVTAAGVRWPNEDPEL
ncbi:hypothetical protein [Streptomyces bacillaris]|uniref:hypothetical protein n=1 Tax=Streptomyces bacillaris TaxID=68179 RepID=UPI00346011AD